MKAARKNVHTGMLALLVLAVLLVPAPTAQAVGETLQVSREVNRVLGGAAVTLTATISKNATSTVKVNFASITGPAKAAAGSCDIDTGTNSCRVIFSSTQEGTSPIRAWIDGTEPDVTEARLANAKPVLDLDGADDCRPTDDELLANTCREGAVPDDGAVEEPDATDVVQITWTSFADARLDCDDGKLSDGEDVEYNAADERLEPYGCLLTTLDNPAHPIEGARIDAEVLGGPLDRDAGALAPVDLNDGCTTKPDGRCELAIQVPDTVTGSGVICFWAEPAALADAAFSETAAIDGAGCDTESVHAPEANDITDAVLLDVDNPRPSRLDATPELQTVASGNRFSFTAGVYDQFDRAYTADTEVRVELFRGSPLDADGNEPTVADLSCRTGAQGKCGILTPPQNVLGTNLACVWFASASAPAAPRMVGDNLDGSCDDEPLTDPSADEGLPQPVTDRVDVVRFTVQSRPGIFTVKPGEKRQDSTDVLRVTGVNFVQGARLSVAGGGVTVGATRFASAAGVEADVRVAADAVPGGRDVTVTNPDGGTVTCGGCFKVVGDGYWMVASDGGIFTFGDARFAGSTGDRLLNQPIVGMAPTPSGEGYWLVASDGGIFAFGDAPFLGSAGNLALNKPIVGMAATPTGRGYWLVASDGGIFTFGDARFLGSTGRLTLKAPIVGITAIPSGRGYWLVASDGGVFAFGDAGFHGSTGDIRLNAPIVSMAASATGGGYWLAAADGGIFTFGDAAFHGSAGSLPLNRPIVGMVTTPLARGYWLVASDGGVFTYGDARFFGSTGNIRLNQPIVAIARR